MTVDAVAEAPRKDLSSSWSASQESDELAPARTLFRTILKYAS